MENKWIISYMLRSDLCSLQTMQIVACPEFNEVGRFNDIEIKEVVNLIYKKQVPQFSERLEGWELFRSELNNEIFELYKK